jgi:hypothetical protein
VFDGGLEETLMDTPDALIVESKGLKKDNSQGHDWLDDAELESPLFAESESANVVRMSRQAASSVPDARLDRFSAYLRHDGASSAEILVAQNQKVELEWCQRLKDLLRFLTIFHTPPRFLLTKL